MTSSVSLYWDVMKLLRGKDWKVLETYHITDTKNILKVQPSQCCLRKQRTQIFDCYYFNVYDHKEWASLCLAKVIYVANYCIIVKETKCFIIACWTVPSQRKPACWCLKEISAFEQNLQDCSVWKTQKLHVLDDASYASQSASYKLCGVRRHSQGQLAGGGTAGVTAQMQACCCRLGVREAD